MTAPTATDQVITIRNLDVWRGGKLILSDLSLDVPRGSVTGLLGPSGSGKTTLLRAIVGVQIVESGSIEVLGLAAGTAELRQRIGYVTQAPSVYADLTVAENVRYFARVLDVPTSEALAVLPTVGLDEYRDRIVGTLSGGERSRVSLAVSLLGAPELLVLDEPTVGLDPVLRLDLWRSFHELADAGTTLLVSTHVMDEAARCDELVLMRDGGIVAADTPSALLERTGATDIEGAFLALAGEAGS